MATKNFNGTNIEVSDEGYLLNSSDWTPEIAVAIAKEEGIELLEKHHALLQFLREKAAKGDQLTIRGVGKSGIVDIKGFYELFPGAPLKLAMKIAGLSKPTSCV